MPTASRVPFSGSRRKLVLALDVGTTFSGISYSILDPGHAPEVRGVTKFPAQEHISGAAKIPTVIYYDRSGKVRAVGAEAMHEEIHEQAVDEDWVKAEWFKLHLRSRVGAGKSVTNASEIPALPPGKTVIELFADFLTYLLKCGKTYVTETHASGDDLWTSLQDEIDYVLSHPNGWEGKEQADMRRAAVLAKLIPDTKEGHARLTFVTEGEASLHFAVHNGLPLGALEHGEGVVIVDAGGGTIDISSYSKNVGTAKESYEEVAPPQCFFHGSIFVTVHSKIFLQSFLEQSQYVADLEKIVRCFDKTTKLRFRNAQQIQYIKFGTVRDNDEDHDIRYGQLKLSGSDVAQFFKPSIDCVVQAVTEQRKVAHKSIKHVVFVGGFSSSDWLVSQVQAELRPQGFNVIRAENYVNKAVSDGAISFYLDHYVRTRVSKVTFGMFCNETFDSSQEDHRERESRAYAAVSGIKRLPDFFAIILPKNSQVSETKEFRHSFNREATASSELKDLTCTIQCYRGLVDPPRWKDVDNGNYTAVCTIHYDLSEAPFKPVRGPDGREYSVVVYEVVLAFGLTEFKAYVTWKDEGVEKRSEPKIVYDPSDPHPLQESSTTDAVSDGAISFYLDHFVRSRISKVTYGNFCHIPFDPLNHEHRARLSKTFVSVSGNKRISDSFDVILPKNTEVSETREFRKSFFRESESRNDFQQATFAVWCYRGENTEPRWKDVDTPNYAKLCTIDVDLSHLPLAVRVKPAGGSFFRLDYDIVLLFGGTELRGFVAWKENGVEKRSMIKILYDPDT